MKSSRPWAHEHLGLDSLIYDKRKSRLHVGSATTVELQGHGLTSFKDLVLT